MTMQEREEIFAREMLTIADIQALYLMKYQDAAKLIRDVKTDLQINSKYNGQGVRLDIKGRLHVQDYLDWIGVTEFRYGCKNIEKEVQV